MTEEQIEFEFESWINNNWQSYIYKREYLKDKLLFQAFTKEEFRLFCYSVTKDWKERNLYSNSNIPSYWLFFKQIAVYDENKMFYNIYTFKVFVKKLKFGYFFKKINEKVIFSKIRTF